MTDLDDFERIAPQHLRLGMYVRLDLSWLQHPFPSNTFRIRDEAQLATLLALGLDAVRYSPSRSDRSDSASAAAQGSASPAAPPSPAGSPARADAVPPAASPELSPLPSARLAAADIASRQTRLQQQRAAFTACEQKFQRTAEAVRDLLQSLPERPAGFRQHIDELADSLLRSVLDNHDLALTVIGDNALGYDDHVHGTNVMVTSVILGTRLGLDAEALRLLGEAALLHDVGKRRLPPHVARRRGRLSAQEQEQSLRHTEYGVEIARQLGLPEAIVEVIAQHHEHMDGSGTPLGLRGEQISHLTRIVAIANHFDDLCNKPDPAHSLTPYEALAQMYAKEKAYFDPVMLAAFIRGMGIYPPGSLVRLSDGRAAIVQSTHAAQPLQPTVLIHDPAVPRDAALFVDLAREPSLNISKSLRPAQLSTEEFAYLAPRKRVTYFFDELATPIDAAPAS